ncbi:MAG: hypothetical protein HYS98_06680 [Deltaproteobacteria bacterium]|nr:hypothetical protein [Deltaproteobacteria bacterium]
MRIKAFINLIVVVLLGITLSSCSESESGQFTRKNKLENTLTPDVPQSPDAPQSNDEKIPEDDLSLSESESPPDALNKAPHPKYTIAFLGHFSVLDEKLYTLSSNAHNGVPVEVRTFNFNVIDIVSAEKPDSLYCILESDKGRFLAKVNIETGFVSHLTKNINYLSHLTISDNHSVLGYISKSSNGVQALHIYDIKSKALKSFNTQVAVNDFTFSHDGTKVYYTLNKKNSWLTYEVMWNAKPLKWKQLEENKNGKTVKNFKILDSGKNIIYLDSNIKGQQIHLWDATTKKRILLYQGNQLHELALSPDEKYLVFFEQTVDGQFLKLLNLNTRFVENIDNILVPLKNEDGFIPSRVHPVWTPDSMSFFYGSFDGRYGSIYKYDLEAKEITRLTDSIYTDFYHPIVLEGQVP